MSERGTVLVVDDDEAIRKLVVRVLRREQYDVSEAVDGADALDHLRARHFDALVLDLMMPVMSGFEVVEYLASHTDAGQPPVIVISAAAERDFDRLQRSPLVRRVLRKPFDIPQLIAAVVECKATE